jgi:lipid II:glycine glycyltransferase (peptidoglycan interpeptide bridge formation enzyme)
MRDTVREATPAELAGWDGLTVDVPGGQVFQSRAWSEHRASSGWKAHHLVCPDGRGVLALERPWPVVGGSRAYLPRGPVTVGDPPEQVAGRLAAVTDWLAARGVDVVTSDAELPATTGYAERLAALGFQPVEELQPARHRMSLAIDGASEDEVLAGVTRQTRQRIRGAEGDGVVVRRFDRDGEHDPGQGFAPGPAHDLVEALTRFHALVAATGERRGFQLGPLAPFLAWLVAAHRAGLAVYLEAQLAGGGPALGGSALDGQPLAGLLVYRQGDRLSTAISGDDAAGRAAHPGVLHLLRWRAIQLAVREGRREMDLGGVDIAGARHEPTPGEAMHGLYQHKRSFGAVFVEQVGAHERVLRPWHLGLARTAARVAGRLR